MTNKVRWSELRIWTSEVSPLTECQWLRGAHNVIRHRVKRWSNVSLVGSFFVRPMMMNVRPPPPPSMLWLMRRHLITLRAQFMGFNKFYTFGTFEWQKWFISYIFYAESIYRKCWQKWNCIAFVSSLYLDRLCYLLSINWSHMATSSRFSVVFCSSCAWRLVTFVFAILSSASRYWISTLVLSMILFSSSDVLIE